MLSNYLLQTAAPASGGSGWSTIAFMGAFFAIFYFFMIRPQMKKAKEQKKMQEALKVGDKVMTIGGVHGEIIELDATTVILKLDQGRMRIERAAISTDRTISEGQQNK
ncbi:MAG: preprotein translocase subunit YajC [Bacteroidota bacterium]|jgi:preprotein translocase subunit YajC